MATLAAWPCLLREEPRRQLVCTRGGPAPPSGPISQPQAPQDHSPQLPSWGVGRGPAPPPSCACSICREGHPRGARGGKLGVGGWGRGRVPQCPASCHWDQPPGTFPARGAGATDTEAEKQQVSGPRGETGHGGHAGQEIQGGRALSSITEGDFVTERWRNVNPV